MTIIITIIVDPDAADLALVIAIIDLVIVVTIDATVLRRIRLLLIRDDPIDESLDELHSKM